MMYVHDFASYLNHKSTYDMPPIPVPQTANIASLLGTGRVGHRPLNRWVLLISMQYLKLRRFF